MLQFGPKFSIIFFYRLSHVESQVTENHVTENHVTENHVTENHVTENFHPPAIPRLASSESNKSQTRRIPNIDHRMSDDHRPSIIDHRTSIIDHRTSIIEHRISSIEPRVSLCSATEIHTRVSKENDANAGRLIDEEEIQVGKVRNESQKKNQIIA